jgi:hypothetical protein
MSIPYVIPIDMKNNQILNRLIQLLASDPTGIQGLEWVNTTSNRYKWFDGTTIQTVAQLTDSLDKFAAAAAAVSMGGNKLTNLATPTASTDAAPKGYVDAAIQGLSIKDSVAWATTAALAAGTYSAGVFTETANGALSIDGSSPAVGDRVLVKNQATASQNGVYTVTQAGDGSHPFILTRATDLNTSAQFVTGIYVFVEGGTANAATGWLLTTANPITLDTTSLTFTQFNAAGGVVAGSGINVAGTTVSVLTDGTTISVISSNLSVKSSATAGQHLRSAGSGAAVWTSDNYAVSIGDGSTLSYTVNHALGSTDIMVQVWETGGSKRQAFPEIDITDSNNIAVVFSAAPSSNAYRVVVSRIG